VENLDPAVATIGDVDASHRTADCDIVRIVEIARRRSFVTPGLDETAILGEFEDAGIVRNVAAMAGGNKNSAVGPNRDPGRRMTEVGALPADADLAKHHQPLAVLIELENLLSKDDAGSVAR